MCHRSRLSWRVHSTWTRNYSSAWAMSRARLAPSLRVKKAARQGLCQDSASAKTLRMLRACCEFGAAPTGHLRHNSVSRLTLRPQRSSKTCEASPVLARGSCRCILAVPVLPTKLSVVIARSEWNLEATPSRARQSPSTSPGLLLAIYSKAFTNTEHCAQQLAAAGASPPGAGMGGEGAHVRQGAGLQAAT